MGMDPIDDVLQFIESKHIPVLSGLAHDLRQAWETWRKTPVDPTPFFAQTENLKQLQAQARSLADELNTSRITLRAQWSGHMADVYLGPSVTPFEVEHDMEPNDTSVSFHHWQTLFSLSNNLAYNVGAHRALADKLKKIQSLHDTLNTQIKIAGAGLAVMVAEDAAPGLGELADAAEAPAEGAEIGAAVETSATIEETIVEETTEEEIQTEIETEGVPLPVLDTYTIALAMVVVGVGILSISLAFLAAGTITNSAVTRVTQAVPGVNPQDVQELLDAGFTADELIQLLNAGYTIDQIKALLKQGLTVHDIMALFRGGMNYTDVANLIAYLRTTPEASVAAIEDILDTYGDKNGGDILFSLSQVLNHLMTNPAFSTDPRIIPGFQQVVTDILSNSSKTKGALFALLVMMTHLNDISFVEDIRANGREAVDIVLKDGSVMECKDYDLLSWWYTNNWEKTLAKLEGQVEYDLRTYSGEVFVTFDSLNLPDPLSPDQAARIEEIIHDLEEIDPRVKVIFEPPRTDLPPFP